MSVNPRIPGRDCVTYEVPGAPQCGKATLCGHHEGLREELGFTRVQRGVHRADCDVCGDPEGSEHGMEQLQVQAARPH